MKKLLSILFLFQFARPAFGQQVEPDQFVNKVLNLLIDSNLQYFYLVECPSSDYLTEGSIKNLNAELRKIAKPARFVIKVVDTKFCWKGNQVDRAKLISYNQQQNQFEKIKTDWANAITRHRESLGLNESEYDKLAMTGSLPKTNKSISDFIQLNKEEQQIYFIGKPIFNISYDYALIEFAESQGSFTTTGYTCLFTKSNGKWWLMKKFNWWAS